MNARPAAFFSRLTPAVCLAIVLAATCVPRLLGQNAATPAAPPGPVVTLVSREWLRTIPYRQAGDQMLVALDDLATAFQLTVREESGAVTVSYKGRTIVLTPDQTLASVAGRLISLPSPLTRTGTKWTVPIEFISRALAPIYDAKLELRRPSSLVVVGDVRVPRVAIRYEPLAAATRLTIDATPNAASSITQENGRLSVKFDADALDLVIPGFQSQGFVQAIHPTDAVTLALDLGPRFAAYRASTETIGTTTRLVLDVVGAAGDPAAAGTPSAAAGLGAPGAPGVPGASGGAGPAGAVPAPPPDLTQLGPPVSAIRTIAIDAGHGGDDLGTTGPAGTHEKDVTLTVARRLKAAVEARLGVRVVLTRDDDRALPIDERTAIANNSKVDLFISLHTNASLRAGPSGASIMVAAFDETADSRPTLTPERLATFGGGARDIELVPWDLAQIRFVEQSTQLAHILEQQFQNRIAVDSHPVEVAPIRLLESANMPAVLVEMGYLSNADQEKQLAGGEFQNAFVQAVIDAVLKFRDYLDASSDTAAPKPANPTKPANPANPANQ